MALASNKIVCITGASRGIGRGCALEFAKHGASGLVLHYFETDEEILALKAEIELYDTRVVTVYGDISDPATSTTASIPLDAVDVLVSNAGICPFHEFLTMPLEIYERTRKVNLDGSFYIVQAVANQMKNQTPQGGAIVAISSISAFFGGEFQCHYTPTKAAILSLMQSCAIALGKYGIRANAVLPGTIATDINKEDLSDSDKREYMIKRTALGRLGAPDDIAWSRRFLSQRSSEIYHGNITTSGWRNG
ncbi:NAD(P)-binding protein [Armillaria luteobubalina]|uniref:NAD(P)-binding protein n=1 Tax=Armillaria luteobubalina TaxID=153913 RepID=A0AA39QNF1_9AGAR|nr:NAD(P)-binding protein [Armillaria luteobubalina]